MKQLHRLIFLGGSMFFLHACASSHEEEQTSTKSVEASPSATASIQRDKLQVVSVNAKTKSVETRVRGRVIPRNSTHLFAEVQGVVEPTRLVFKPGTRFQKGDVLLRVDAQEFALNLEAQRSSFLNTLTATLPDLQADYPANYEAWLRYVESYQWGQELKPLPETVTDGETYFITSRGIYTAYFSVKSQEERLRKYVIRAPYNGMVTASNIDVGGLVAPGQSLGQIMYTDAYELEAGVSLSEAASLNVGDEISFRSNAREGEWTGRVIRVGGTVDSKTQNVPVFVALEGTDLRPGMYLEGTLRSRGYADVFVIHNSTLGRDESVLILEEDRIIRKPVTLLEFLQDSILVTGLANNDQLILNQFQEPVDGQKVAI